MNSKDISMFAHALTLRAPELKIVEITNRVDLDEAAHHHLPCLSSSLWTISVI